MTVPIYKTILCIINVTASIILLLPRFTGEKKKKTLVSRKKMIAFSTVVIPIINTNQLLQNLLWKKQAHAIFEMYESI